MARTPVATDDFNRTDEGPIASPWGTYTGGGSLRVAYEAAYAVAAPTAVVNIQTHNATLATDQYVQAVPTVDNAASALMLYLRVSASGTPTGYELWSGYGADMLIRRMSDATTFVTLATLTGHVLATGQTPSFEAVGTDLIAYIDGSEIGRATDATYASGRAGLGVYIGYGGTGHWDDFVCGDVTTTDSALLTILRALDEARA